MTTTIDILPQQITINIELEYEYLINEIFDYIQISFEIQSNTRDWTCYSEERGIFLSYQDYIGNYKYKNLTINTQPKPKSSTSDDDLENSLYYINSKLQYASQIQNKHNQLSPYIQYQPCNQYNSGQQTKLYQNQIFDSTQCQVPLERWESVIINFEIINGSKKYYLQCTYREDDILHDLAKTVLAYLRVSSERASCDLFYKNRCLNNYDTRQQKICQTRFIGSGITLRAQLKWIGLKK